MKRNLSLCGIWALSCMATSALAATLGTPPTESYEATSAYAMEPVRLVTAFVSGTATETGGDVAMTEIMPESTSTGIFESYQRLQKGEFVIKGFTGDGEEVTLGDNGSGTFVEDGDPLTIDEEGVSRIRIDTNTGDITVTAMVLYLKGNIVADGTTVDYVGNGVFSQEVVFDDTSVSPFSNKTFYFAFNNNNRYALRRLNGDHSHVGLLSEGFNGENMLANGGTYTITLDMSNYTWDIYAPVDEYKISAFGSSTSEGGGATNYQGYAYQYNEQLQTRYVNGESNYPFTLANTSIGGNSVQNLLDRYDDVIHDFSRYVLIGLGMTNEGFYDTSDLTRKQSILDSFYDRLGTLVSMLRADGKVPVIMCGYPRNDASTTDAEWQKDINIYLNEWDVPMVNSYDPVNDTEGHWVSSYYNDNLHPSNSGHEQLMSAIPSSLFDAMTEGKPLCNQRDLSKSTVLKDGATIYIAGETTLYPFTIMVRFRGSDAGKILTFSQVSASPFTVKVLDGGYVQYVDTSGNEYTSSEPLLTDDETWHYLTVTKYYAQGCTILYFDKTCLGTVNGRGRPLTYTFTVGDTDEEVEREYSELFLWRSPLNEKEVEYVVDGNMFQASLDIYSPLSDDIIENVIIENLAQSLNAATYVEYSVPESIRSSLSNDDASDSSEEYYSTSGVRQTGLQHGVNIIKSGNSVTKQIVR